MAEEPPCCREDDSCEALGACMRLHSSLLLLLHSQSLPCPSHWMSKWRFHSTLSFDPVLAIKCLGWWKNKSCLSHTGHLKLKCVFLSIVSFSTLHLKGGTDPDVTLTDAVMNHRQQEMENTYTAVFGWGLCAINKHKGCFSSVKSRKLWIISY